MASQNWRRSAAATSGTIRQSLLHVWDGHRVKIPTLPASFCCGCLRGVGAACSGVLRRLAKAGSSRRRVSTRPSGRWEPDSFEMYVFTVLFIFYIWLTVISFKGNKNYLDYSGFFFKILYLFIYLFFLGPRCWPVLLHGRRVSGVSQLPRETVQLDTSPPGATWPVPQNAVSGHLDLPQGLWHQGTMIFCMSL